MSEMFDQAAYDEELCMTREYAEVCFYNMEREMNRAEQAERRIGEALEFLRGAYGLSARVGHEVLTDTVKAALDALTPDTERSSEVSAPMYDGYPGSGPRLMPSNDSARNTVDAHSFRPLKPWDALHGGGRCKRCYVPRSDHPIHGWVRARPLGDKSKAELSWEALHG